MSQANRKTQVIQIPVPQNAHRSEPRMIRKKANMRPYETSEGKAIGMGTNALHTVAPRLTVLRRDGNECSWTWARRFRQSAFESRSLGRKISEKANRHPR